MDAGKDLYSELEWKKVSETSKEGILETTDLFLRDVVDGELDLAHAACAEGLGEGIVAEDSVCGAGLF